MNPISDPNSFTHTWNLINALAQPDLPERLRRDDYALERPGDHASPIKKPKAIVRAS